MRRPVVLSLTVAVLSGMCVAGTAQAAPVASVARVGASSAEPPSVPGELLVGYVKGAKGSDQARARGRAGAERKEPVVAAAADRSEVELVRLPAGKSRAQAEKELESDPAVAYAEPNWIYQHLGKPGAGGATPDYFADGKLWGMYGANTSPSNIFGSGAAAAWANGNVGEPQSGSPTVYIGVIDEGIQHDHPDLAGQVGNPGELGLSANANDDGNLYVDDIHGWDFVRNDNTVYDGGSKGSADDHGTHVSGTIAAKASNEKGVIGVSRGAKLISGKFLGPNGGSLANAVRAVDYFTDLRQNRGVNIVATSNSWGGGGFSQALLDAITAGARQGILFVAAAGNSNSNNDVTESYPSNYSTSACPQLHTCAVPPGGWATYDGVIAVAAIDKLGNKASFSSYGATTVDLGAPGVDVWSTTAYSSYSSYNGTSMATPHVTGGAALYAARHPSASAAQIKQAIIDAARATETASLVALTDTGGRLNVSGF